jgi:hypothetical protein
MKTVADEIVHRIESDAKRWSVENGLKEPLLAHMAIEAFGFKVQVEEVDGKKLATCSYQRNGQRSMYELDRKGA